MSGRGINLNLTDNSDCPCRRCEERFVGCHSVCIKYIDWQQAHEAKLNQVRVQRGQTSACFEGRERREKSMGRKVLNFGRKKKGS